MSAPFGPISYNGFNLDDRDIYHIRRDLIWDTVAPTINRMQLVSRNGSIISDIRHDERTLQLRGSVFGDNMGDLMARRDVLITTLNSPNGQLRIGFPDSRYYVANLSQLYGEVQPFVWEYEAEFLVADPVAYGNFQKSQTYNQAFSPIGGGDYRVSLSTPTLSGNLHTWPRIQLRFLAGVNITRFRIRNIQTEEDINSWRSFALNDVIVVDGELMSVTQQGFEIDYTGKFVSFDPRYGANNEIQITVRAASTPTVEVRFDFRDRYL